MKYIVIDVKKSYAIVLKDDGKFIKCANMHYEVGQEVDEIYELKEEKKERYVFSFTKPFIALASLCLIMVLGIRLMMPSSPYAKVILSINPDVLISLNENNIVTDIKGQNEDGEKLITDYDYEGKDIEVVSNELVDRAIEQDYLHEGDIINIYLDSEDEDWLSTFNREIGTSIKTHLDSRISVTIIINYDDNIDYYSSIVQSEIPIKENQGSNNAPSNNNTNYEPVDDGMSDYENNSDYEEDNSDYE